MNPNLAEDLWVERWRPTTIRECILPPSLEEMFLTFVQQRQFPNMIFSGPSGTGKTTAAIALCKELGLEYIIINGSEESGIDVLRTKIRSFVSTRSFTGDMKVIILDEADYLNQNSTQPALRRFMEEFSQSARFIFTCNYKNRIIKPLHSRTTAIDFVIPKELKSDMAARFFARAKAILLSEKIQYDSKVVAALIFQHFPDFRRVINEMQRESARGSLSHAVLSENADPRMANLLTFVKSKNFNKLREWVATHVDNDAGVMMRRIYDVFLPEVTHPGELVLILANYQFKAAFCHDQEINMVACLTEIMMSCEFNKA